MAIHSIVLVRVRGCIIFQPDGLLRKIDLHLLLKVDIHFMFVVAPPLDRLLHDELEGNQKYETGEAHKG